MDTLAYRVKEVDVQALCYTLAEVDAETLIYAQADRPKASGGRGPQTWLNIRRGEDLVFGLHIN